MNVKNLLSCKKENSHTFDSVTVAWSLFVNTILQCGIHVKSTLSCLWVFFVVYIDYNNYGVVCVFIYALFPPASAVEGIKSVLSLCVCVRLCVRLSALSPDEPFDVQTQNLVEGLTLIISRMTLKVKVIGRRSRSLCWKTSFSDIFMVWPV